MWEITNLQACIKEYNFVNVEKQPINYALCNFNKSCRYTYNGQYK